MKNLLLYMGNGIFIESFGGAERVACTMANEFTKRGWNVSIVCNDQKSGRPAYPLLPSVRLFNLNGTGKIIYRIPRRLKILKEITRPLRRFGFTFFFDCCERARFKQIAKSLNTVLSEVQPDLILPFFIHDLMTLYYSSAISKIPIIQMLHDTPNTCIKNHSFSPQEALCRVYCVQVLLKSFIPELKRQCEARPVVIPNAVPQYTEMVKYRSSGPLRIVNVARLEPLQKQQDILIDAFARLAGDFPEWTLHFYGADSDNITRQILKNQIEELGLEDRIFLEGTTDRVKETLLDADIFAFPSAREGFGIALLEAMRIGLPTIGFRSAPAVNELIKENENGILTDDGAECFAEGLRKLMENPELRKRLGKNGRIFAEQFAPEKVWDQWEKLCIQAIEESSEKSVNR